jgi:hypothetical protein
MNGIIATSDSFSVSDIPRSIEFEPFKIVDHLINAWCERRALRPLRYLLDAYPGILAHTDQQFELVEALKKVKALCRDDLTKEERRLVTQTHDFFEERLRTRVI